MARVPAPEEITVCEIDGVLLTRAIVEGEKQAADNLYARVLGKWYPTLVIRDLSDPSAPSVPLSDAPSLRDGVPAAAPSQGGPGTARPQGAGASRGSDMEGPQATASSFSFSFPKMNGADDAGPSASRGQTGTSDAEGSSQAGKADSQVRSSSQAQEQLQQQQQEQQRQQTANHQGSDIQQTQQAFPVQSHGMHWIQALSTNLMTQGLQWLGLATPAAEGLQSLSGPTLTWHPRKESLAVVACGGKSRVLVFDLDSMGPIQMDQNGTFGFGWPDAGGQTSVFPGTPGPSLTLAHEFQQDVASLSWRPNAATTLAAGCYGGVCLWDTAAALDSPSLSAVTAHQGLQPWTLSTIVDAVQRLAVRQSQLARCGARFLEASGLVWQALTLAQRAPVSSLAWSPCGRLLAGAVTGHASVLVWDVASGERTHVRSRPGAVTLLHWSPRSDCLLACRDRRYLQLWEAHTWECREWEFAGHSLSSAVWSGDGRMCLLGFHSSSLVRAVYVAGVAPQLDATVLPAELPGQLAEEESSSGLPGARLSLGYRGVVAMAWDPSGERLAVAYHGGPPRLAGLIALYATRQYPIFQASLLGYIRGPVQEVGQAISASALSFHPSFAPGALLSVVWSHGVCSVYPLLFDKRT